ncbi:unnamed protein product [Ceratitis capitata]|uniref:(Mediterranean fruit fly) hypothetical protein n=1 Tax=Ceratitis capitata TaxID=7213 RepID=A0A811UK87_CERCA|nr:unnamed protein product [Ceratitis capitata]
MYVQNIHIFANKFRKFLHLNATMPDRNGKNNNTFPFVFSFGFFLTRRLYLFSSVWYKKRRFPTYFERLQLGSKDKISANDGIMRQQTEQTDAGKLVHILICMF